MVKLLYSARKKLLHLLKAATKLVKHIVLLDFVTILASAHPLAIAGPFLSPVRLTQ